MPRDIREMLDTKYLRSFHLTGDTKVTITKIQQETVGWGKKSSNKPAFYFLELDKPLAMNATNVATIGQLYGTHDADELLGKELILFPTTCEMQGKIVDCIRIRPKGHVPRGTPARQQNRPPHNTENPFPPATQADQLIADEQLKKSLDQAFAKREFTDIGRMAFLEYVCERKRISDVYALDPRQRSDMLTLLNNGSYDRFKNLNGSPVPQVA